MNPRGDRLRVVISEVDNPSLNHHDETEEAVSERLVTVPMGISKTTDVSSACPPISHQGED
eukprot:766716-Hanusia_phi.AAC.6